MKLFTALENEVVAEPTAEYQQRIQSLEEQLSNHEIVEAYDEVQANQNISNNAEADVGTLTKVNDILTEATESNKVLTKDVLQMTRVVTESICSRLGYKATGGLFISTEDVDASTKYQDAISMESFGEVIKRTWEAIIRFFQRIVDGIKNLWNALFSRNTVSKAKNERNHETIQELKQAPIQEKPSTDKSSTQLSVVKKTIEIKSGPSKELKTRIDLIKIRNYFYLTGLLDNNKNDEENRDALFRAISGAVLSATQCLRSIEKEINDILMNIEKIDKLDDVSVMEALVDKVITTHIFKKKEHFKDMCIEVKDTSDNHPEYKKTDWTELTPHMLDHYEGATSYFWTSLASIDHLDNLSYRIKDLTEQIDKTSRELKNINKHIENLMDKHNKELDKKITIGNYEENKVIRDRLPFVSRLLKILNFYTTIIPRICSDISVRSEQYITENLEAIVHNEKEITA